MGKRAFPAGPMRGWVILHPGGSVEVDYFYVKRWDWNSKYGSRTEWMERFRPGCRIVKATLSWKPPQLPARKRKEGCE